MRLDHHYLYLPAEPFAKCSGSPPKVILSLLQTILRRVENASSARLTFKSPRTVRHAELVVEWYDPQGRLSFSGSSEEFTACACKPRRE